ncbi:hypothetical protein V6N13_016436 [Hibiscus sabdariffa]|uniref:Uncharacterized protein n=2 Tax=Hibiscus sabdariffa TaxID=183260 RepID=A0ABR2BGV3_9ROSI
MGSSIARRWRELSGEKNWEGLLEPLDPDLRCYIIHYCERAGAMGDLFNGDTREPDASKQDFFSKACLVKGNPFKYDVTHFLYAGSNLAASSWFGYVAVATHEGTHALGRRDILVSWRGTKAGTEWLNNAHVYKTSASDIFPIAKGLGAAVHSGFHSLYTRKTSRSRNKTSARQQVLDAVRELVNRHKDEEISITVTGFSLGGALATLTAMDIVVNGYNKPTTGNPDKSCMVTAFTYGSPRIGNAKLRSVFGTLGEHLRLLRIVNKKDHVPKHPSGKILYAHFGKELIVNTSVSNYLERKKLFGFTIKRNDIGSKRKRSEDEDEDERRSKRSRKGTDPLDESEGKSSIRENPFDSHNMDVYAHGVAIKDIETNTPVNKLDHDIALVNKHSNRVKEEYNIPKSWWVGENRKKMLQLENGRWMAV